MTTLSRSRTRSSVPQLSPKALQTFSHNLIAWYRQNARVLPWRAVRDPYCTWVSEIMLQQTRVGVVVEHYKRFLQRFPAILSLALASERDVLAAWSGLGYYRRARMMHKAAQVLVKDHRGTLPSTAAELRRLPGIGVYTSAAIASIAFGERVAVVDGNVERVLLRVLGQPERAGAAAAGMLNEAAQSLLPAKDPGDHNQAMMELGATVCLPRNPLCDICPVFKLCCTRGEHPTDARAPMQSKRVAYALCTRKARGGVAVEVLLQRRTPDASLMPDMLELPQIDPQHLPEADAAFALRDEPVLRVRHAITGTNYYVEIHGIPTPREARSRALRQTALEWVPLRALSDHPLTGLARKVLQRLQLMKAPAARRTPDVPLLIGRASRAGTGEKA